jgi:polysaccharide export outer membrane protein
MTMRMLLLGILVAAVAPAAAAPQDGSAATRAEAEYLLGAGDVIRIDVLDEKDLTRQNVRIDNDGSFEYPYLGRVTARGKTRRDLADAVRKGLIDGGYVINPIVTVDVETPRPRFIKVIGEVRAASKYPLTPGMTLLEGLIAAGGVNTQSAGSRVILQSQAADGTADPTTREFSLDDVLNLKSEANPLLQEDDTISVPGAEKFYVQGQVRNTGEQVWEPGMTVRAAIAKAGGVNEKGSTRRVRIIRMIDGKEKKIDADLDTPVQVGDFVEVGQRLL